MVFLVIACTVTVQGLTGGIVASLLKVRRASNQGYLIMGANDLGVLLGDALRESGEIVEFIDSNPDRCKAADERGFKVHHGNGLDEKTLARAHADIRIGCLGVTPREDANFLFAQKVRTRFKGPDVFVALETEADGVTEPMVRKAGVHVLFGAECLLDNWIHHLHEGSAEIHRWQLSSEEATAAIDIRRSPKGWALPLVVKRRGTALLIDERYEPKRSDTVIFAVESDHLGKISDWLEGRGWKPVGRAVTRTGADNGAPAKAPADPSPEEVEA
jgi:Trk K+ transport system NAD-binding subunit